VDSAAIARETSPGVTRAVEDEQAAGVRISVAEFAASCALVAALAWSIHARMRPGPALGEDVPVAQFSAARAQRELAQLLPQDRPRPAGSTEHARVRESIVSALRNAGCEPEVQETLARGPTGRIAIVRNVLARIPGSEGGAAVLVCAHYDSVGASPGAADDASGVATLIELARAAAAGPRARNDLIALFTDASEVGMEGARAFAEQHPWMSTVAVALDLQAYGSSGPCMAVDVARNDAWLVDAIASAAHRPWLSSAHDAVFKNVPDETDFSVFRERGVGGATLAFLGQSWNNHTMRDRAAALDAASLQEQGDCALAIVRVVSKLDLRGRERGEAVFTDVLGLAIVRWREGASPVIALAALALALATAESSRRKRIVSVRSLAVGAVACGAAFVACALGGALPIELADAVRRGRDAGLEHPHALAAALFAGIACGLALAALLIRRARVQFTDLWLASSAACASAGTLAALLRPELSGLFVLPSLAIALVGAVARVDVGCPRPARAARSCGGRCSRRCTSASTTDLDGCSPRRSRSSRSARCRAPCRSPTARCAEPRSPRPRSASCRRRSRSPARRIARASRTRSTCAMSPTARRIATPIASRTTRDGKPPPSAGRCPSDWRLRRASSARRRLRSRG
jgi:hypothetical protein